jgi:hypothetical protein
MTRLERISGQLALAQAIDGIPCACGLPRWRVASTRGKVRYLKCRCGRTAKCAATDGRLQACNPAPSVAGRTR